MSQAHDRASRPIRSAGVRLEYALAGAVTGAALALVIGVIVTLTLTKLGTINSPTGGGIAGLAGLGAIVGAARGSAVSTRVMRAGLRITNPLRRHTLAADQVSKIVSVPGSSGRRPACLGVMLTGSYVQIPIRALRLPRLGSGHPTPSGRAAVFADIARWAQQHEIPFRASAEEWNALLRAEAVRTSN